MWKRILIWTLIAGTALLIVLSLFGVPYYTSNHLPYLLNKKNTTPYAITYNKADISLIGNVIVLEEVTAIPKKAIGSKSTENGFYLKIKQVRLQGLDRMKLIKGEEITANKLEILEPEVIWYNPPKEEKRYAHHVKTELKQPLEQLFQLSSLRIINGQFYIKEKQTDKLPKLSIRGIQFSAKNMNVSPATIQAAIPASVARYEFKADSAHFRPKGVYSLQTGKINISNESFSITDLQYSTPLSKQVYTAQLQTERDWYNIKVPEIKATQWQLNTDSTQLKTTVETLILRNFDAAIFRDKRVADDFRTKPLYNELLRKLPFDLQLDTLHLQNGKISYSEQINENGAGELKFSQFTLIGTGIGSRDSTLAKQPVRLQIKTQFMDVAPTQVDWNFDIANLQDEFTMKGTVRKLPLSHLRPFIRPYLNIEAEGSIAEVAFNLYGNQEGAKGDFSADYRNLKVEVFQKEDRKKKHKLGTALANLVIKQDKKKAPTDEVEIQVEREKHKSFYNLFWKSLADGLKKSMLANPLNVLDKKEKDNN